MWNDDNDEGFRNSPEHEDWIEETGGRDEALEDYYQDWEHRTRQ